MSEWGCHVDVSVVLQIDGVRALTALQVGAPAGQDARLRKRGAVILIRVTTVRSVAVEISSDAADSHTAAQSSVEVVAIVGAAWLLVSVAPVRVAPAALLVVIGVGWINVLRKTPEEIILNMKEYIMTFKMCTILIFLSSYMAKEHLN